MIWIPKHPDAKPYMLGFIPSFLSDDDPRSAREQINSNYVSGWNPNLNIKNKITLLPNGNFSYPNDPETQLLYETQLRNETIRFYEHAWVIIIQKNGDFEIDRLD